MATRIHEAKKRIMPTRTALEVAERRLYRVHELVDHYNAVFQQYPDNPELRALLDDLQDVLGIH